MMIIGCSAAAEENIDMSIWKKVNILLLSFQATYDVAESGALVRVNPGETQVRCCAASPICSLLTASRSAQCACSRLHL
jgi:hypothetical protein